MNFWHKLKRKQKIAIGAGTIAIILIVIGVIFLLRGSAQPTAEATPTPMAAPSPQTRGLSREKFPPRPRPQSAANVDVGVRTLSSSPSPSPKLSAITLALANTTSSIIAQAASPSPSPAATSQPARPGIPATPAPGVPAATPAPPLPPPTFTPLTPALPGQGRELVIVYAKGESGKRQIFMRSLERDKDDQLVSSVYDDYGVSFSSASQKVAFYSNEEGPSDSTRARTKLKVVDLATGKTQTIAGNLPGAWPVAWSPDGSRLAIPTANEIFVADVAAGTSVRVPTAKNPGAIVWATGSIRFNFQAEAGTDNNDIFEADALTAQARTVVSTEKNETSPAPSDDGSKVSFMRDQANDKKGAAITTKTLSDSKETTYAESQPAESYLWNLQMNELMFVRNDGAAKLYRLKGTEVSPIGDLGSPVVLSWDRDYQHVFVIADDDDSKALFTVDVKSGQAEKVKAGVSDSIPSVTR